MSLPTSVPVAIRNESLFILALYAGCTLGATMTFGSPGPQQESLAATAAIVATLRAKILQCVLRRYGSVMHDSGQARHIHR